MSFISKWNNVIDGFGDLLHTSDFSKEKDAWKYLVGADLTRHVYNKNKQGFNFRHAEIYAQEGHIFTVADRNSPFFDNEYECTRAVKDRIIEAKNAKEQVIGRQMFDVASQYGIPVNQAYLKPINN